VNYVDVAGEKGSDLLHITFHYHFEVLDGVKQILERDVYPIEKIMQKKLE